jgi:N-acetylglutamate synthase
MLAQPMFGPDDLGHRVVIRRFVGTRDDRPIFTDILGELTAWGEDTVTVATRRGEVTIPRREIARAKRIPPAASRPDRSQRRPDEDGA